MFEEKWQVYGVRKVWRQLGREGFDVALCTVARLMKSMGIQGIIRGEPLTAIGPRTMASDFTYVATWKEFVYVALVIDA